MNIYELTVLEGFLTERTIFFRKDVSLSTISWLRSGGSVKALAYPKKKEELLEILGFCFERSFEFKIIGSCSNILFNDKLVHSFFISTEYLNNTAIENDYLVASTGVQVGHFTRFALMAGLSGFEGLEGIPGTLGGAMALNAGAYGYTISDYLVRSTWWDSGELLEVDKGDMDIGHRRPLMPSPNSVFIEGMFQFPLGISKVSEKKIQVFHSARHRYQEFTFPNLGSIFVTNGENIHDLVVRSEKFVSQHGLLVSKLILLIFRCARTRVISNYRRFFPFFNVYSYVLRRFVPELYELQGLSSRTLNTLANRSLGTKDFLLAIECLRTYLPDLVIENEVFTGCVFISKEMGDRDAN